MVTHHFLFADDREIAEVTSFKHEGELRGGFETTGGSHQVLRVHKFLFLELFLVLQEFETLLDVLRGAIGEGTIHHRHCYWCLSYG